MRYYEQKIEDAWETKSRKTDWLGLEDTIRAILQDDGIPQERRLGFIEDAVAAFTRRGYCNGNVRKYALPTTNPDA